VKVYSELGANTREFSLKFYNFFLVTAAGLVSAALSYFGTGLHPIWWLLWLAPVPVLAIASRLHGGAAFLLGFIAWLIGEMNQWNYVRHQIIAETATVPGRFVSITGKVNVAHEQTFYTRTGDWFAWLCVAMFVILLTFPFLARSRSP